MEQTQMPARTQGEPDVEFDPLAWANRVRELLEKPTLAEWPERDGGGMLGSPLAQALGCKVFTDQDGGVFAIVGDKKLGGAIHAARAGMVKNFRYVPSGPMHWEIRLPRPLYPYARGVA